MDEGTISAGNISTVVILLFLGGTLWMLWPFMGAILFGVLTAYILHFLEVEVYKRTDNRVVSHVAVFLVLLVFLGGVVYGTTTSVPTLTSNVDKFLEAISGTTAFLVKVFNLPASLADVFGSVLEEIGVSIQSAIIGQFQKLPTLMIHFFIYLVTAVYFFKEGPLLRTKLFYMMEQMDEHRELVLKELARGLNDLFRGVFLTRIVMATIVLFLASIGLYMMGIEFWWGWSLLMAVFSFLPILGPFLLYVPLGIIYMAIGDFWLGVVIILYGVLVLDMFLLLYVKPQVETQRAKYHPVILLIGFVGGPMVMGAKGVILGPLVLVMTLKFVMEIYRAQASASSS